MNNILDNISLFINYLDIERNYSKRTIRNYSFWLNRFQQYLENFLNKKYIEDIEAMDIFKFRSFLSSE